MRDVGVALLMGVAAVGLAACDVETRVPGDGAEAVAIKADGDGRVAFNLPFAHGEVKLPADMIRTADFEIGGVSMIPGGTITGFDVNAAGEQARVNMSFSAPVAPQEVRTYFVEQFAAKKVAVEAAADAITGTTRDGSAFIMRFAPEGTGTKGTIEIAPRS